MLKSKLYILRLPNLMIKIYYLLHIFHWFHHHHQGIQQLHHTPSPWEYTDHQKHSQMYPLSNHLKKFIHKNSKLIMICNCELFLLQFISNIYSLNFKLNLSSNCADINIIICMVIHLQFKLSVSKKQKICVIDVATLTSLL